MKKEDFAKLPIRVQKVMLVSMHVRNEMETFHIKHLSDEQMKELNPIIRQAVLEGLEIWEKFAHHLYEKIQHNKQTKSGDAIAYTFDWLVQMLPDYWEIPIQDRIPKKLLQAQHKYRKKVTK